MSAAVTYTSSHSPEDTVEFLDNGDGTVQVNTRYGGPDPSIHGVALSVESTRAAAAWFFNHFTLAGAPKVLMPAPGQPVATVDLIEAAAMPLEDIRAIAVYGGLQVEKVRFIVRLAENRLAGRFKVTEP